MSGMAQWKARLREIGESFLALVRAELAALAADLGQSGRALARALVLVGIAFGVGFWTLGLLLYFAIELLALVLPRWGAVGIVLALFVAVTLILILTARSRFAAIESPAATLERRLDENRRWWRERVAADEEEGE
jgi:putative superfamily III holin-X